MKITYLPLESYPSRYTELMSVPNGWTERALKKRFDPVVTIRGNDTQSTQIKSGQVLDSVRRPTWCMEQMSKLINQQHPDLGKVFFEDFFTAGLEALPYSRKHFQAYSFCWAQSFDMYDFTYRMIDWMRPYELMGYSIYNKVYVACPMLAELINSVSKDFGDRTESVGLPFDSAAVAVMMNPAFTCPNYDITYASRFDIEKQPMEFLNLVTETGVKAAICCGHATLKGTDYDAIKRALEMEKQGLIDIHVNLTKADYYAVLARTHVQFNCALQDWVSFTLLEALTFGCVPLYPNFRAMPDTLLYEEDNLYRPSDMAHAAYKLKKLLSQPRKFEAGSAILDYHDGALGRIADSMHKD